MSLCFRRPALDAATARRLRQIRQRSRGLASHGERHTAIIPRERMADLVRRAEASS